MLKVTRRCSGSAPRCHVDQLGGCCIGVALGVLSTNVHGMFCRHYAPRPRRGKRRRPCVAIREMMRARREGGNRAQRSIHRQHCAVAVWRDVIAVVQLVFCRRAPFGYNAGCAVLWRACPRQFFHVRRPGRGGRAQCVVRVLIRESAKAVAFSEGENEWGQAGCGGSAAVEAVMEARKASRQQAWQVWCGSGVCGGVLIQCRNRCSTVCFH